MKRLHLLVLKSFIGPFILIFFIVLFVLLMQFLWRYIDDLVGKGLDILVIGELLLYTSSSLVPMALPLAILMSALMTFGNMGEFYELTAMKASGISLQRIMAPLIIFIVFVSIGAFFFANDVLPYTNLKMRSLLYDVTNQRPEIQILPGTFYNGIDGYSMRVDRKDPNTNMLYDIKIYDHTQSRGNNSVTLADSGKMIVTEDERSMIFTLYNGYSYNELEDSKKNRKQKTYPHRYDQFEEQEIIIELKGFSLKRTDEDLFRNHYAMLDLQQLELMQDSINEDIDQKLDLMSKTLLHSNYFRKKSTAARQVMQEQKEEELDQVKKDFKDRKQFVRQQTIRDSVNNTTSNQKEIPAIKAANQDTSFYYNLYEKLTPKEKDMVMTSAMSYARSARTYVVSSVNTIDNKVRSLRRFEVEWHRKFTISFACFVFLLIGAPLGAIIRKGGLGLPLVLSALFFIFYYIISLTGEKFVRESIIPAYQGMWLASSVFFITGIFLTYKATTDAAMLNFDTYSNFLKKYLKIGRVTLVEALKKTDESGTPKAIKTEKLIASLNSFRETIAESVEDISNRLNISGYLMSLVGLRETSNIVLLERLYKNIMNTIINSDLFYQKPIKSKLFEFPDFNYKSYHDMKWRLYIRLILLLTPPITLIIIIRHFIQLYSLRNKLKTIDRLTIDLIELLQNQNIAES